MGGEFEEERGAGFGEEEAATVGVKGFAVPYAERVKRCEDAEALEGGLEERVEGGVSSDDEGAAASAAPEGLRGGMEGVESGGAGGDGGGRDGEVEAAGEEGAEGGGAEGDLFSEVQGDGLILAEKFGGGKDGGDGTFAGGGEELDVGGAFGEIGAGWRGRA
jgi:hypothetical protein